MAKIHPFSLHLIYSPIHPTHPDATSCRSHRRCHNPSLPALGTMPILLIVISLHCLPPSCRHLIPFIVPSPPSLSNRIYHRPAPPSCLPTDLHHHRAGLSPPALLLKLKKKEGLQLTQVRRGFELPVTQPSSGGGGSGGNHDSCPIDKLKLEVCADVLHLPRLKICVPDEEQCWLLLQGLIDRDTAVYLCLVIGGFLGGY
nr:unnamed protein product [Digitaria exilis]